MKITDVQLLSDPPVFEQGYLRLPTKPGLGSKLVMKTMDKYRFE